MAEYSSGQEKSTGYSCRRVAPLVVCKTIHATMRQDWALGASWDDYSVLEATEECVGVRSPG
jgi:hypothetical protein